MKILNVEIEKMSPAGHGIANIPKGTDKEIHVLGAFKGDVVDIEVYKTVKNISYAELKKISKKSKLRENDEEHFDSNSPWFGLSHEGENFLKSEIFKEIYPIENISKISSLNKEKSLYYRNKVAYSFMTKKNKDLAFALYTRGVKKSEKIPQKENKLVHPELEKIGNAFLRFFNQKKISEENLKYLILRYSYLENSVVAHILVPELNRKKIIFKKSDLEKFLNTTKNLKGILVSHSEKNIRSAETTKDFYEIGDIHINEKVHNKTYSYHPSLFFQIYPEAFELILSDMQTELEKIPNHKNLPLLDLFSGVGIIGIELSDLVKNIKGVELSKLSGSYARKNAKRNLVQEYSFYEQSADEILEAIESEQILVLDPTRAGISKKCQEQINEIQPKYIFYVSCNPETQARDIESIKNAYEIIFARAYNIFPKTHHIESLIILKKK